MNATSQVIRPAPLFYRHLQMALSATLNQHSQCYEAQVPLTSECREELMWWDTHMINWNGKSLLKKEVDMTIDSDASLTGWGATSQNQRTGGPWSQTESRMHINCLELLAATLAVKTFLSIGRDGHSHCSTGRRRQSVRYVKPASGVEGKSFEFLAETNVGDLMDLLLRRMVEIYSCMERLFVFIQCFILMQDEQQQKTNPGCRYSSGWIMPQQWHT